MPQFPKRKTDREIISHEKMKEAVEKVLAGGSLREVATPLGLSKTTLQRYVQKVKSTPSEAVPNLRLTPNYSVNKIFSDEEEMSLREYLINCSRMNYGLNYQSVRLLAYQFAAENDKKIPESWKPQKIASLDWLKGFMSRHKQLSLRQPEQCSLGRSIAFNRANIKIFFDKLREIYD